MYERADTDMAKIYDVKKGGIRYRLKQSARENLNEKIKKNSIKCLLCNEIIESKETHDLVWCKCKSVAIDGGKDYQRVLGDSKNYTSYEK